MDNISQLNVLLYDKKIGSLHLLPGERILFVFEPEYIENINRPILSLSFKDTFGDLITEFRPIGRDFYRKHRRYYWFFYNWI